MGLGLQSLQDLTNTDTISSTAISLNDFKHTKYWQSKLPLQAPGMWSHEVRMCALHCSESNIYPKLLIQCMANEAANPKLKSKAFLLKCHITPKKKVDNFVGSIIKPFTSLGYTMDAEALQCPLQRESTHSNWLSRCLSKRTFDSMLPYLMKTDQWCMGSFAYPCGTKLLTWSDLVNYTGMSDADPPPWYRNLEQETLVAQASGNRTLKHQYFDSPSTSSECGFCYKESDTLVIVNPVDTLHMPGGLSTYQKYISSGASTEGMHVFTYAGTIDLDLQTPTYIPHIGCPVPLTDTRIYTTNLENTQTPHEIDSITRSALMHQHTEYTRLHGTRRYAMSASSGSMRTDTDASDTPLEEDHVTDDTAYLNESFSDGSVYTFENAQTCAGYAFTRPNARSTLVPVRGDPLHEPIQLYADCIDTIKGNIPCHPVWHSPDATLNYNPSAIDSYKAEAKGLDTAITQFIDDPPRKTSHDRQGCTHYLDNLGVITSAANLSGKKKLRHPIRENEHHTLGDIRSQLDALRGHEPDPDWFTIAWIKGHSGNPHHERADRKAARIAFRHTALPGRYPKNQSNPFCLYFYECLVEGDIRAHIQLVCKEIWLKRWRKHTSQGKMSALTNRLTTKLPALNVRGVSAQDSKLHAKYINGISHTPHRQHQLHHDTPSTCRLCGCLDATEDHIMFHCPHPELETLRQDLDTSLTNTVLAQATSQYVYSQSHPLILHPIERVPTSALYPYATALRTRGNQLITEALPEGRWYRRSKTAKGCITVQHPHNSKHSSAGKRMVQIPVEVFWKLIAWHDITHQSQVMPLEHYDTRAKDLWEAVTRTKEESGDSSLCWAADPTLLDIIIDECKCTTELFSNIMNTYHRFSERRSLYAHPAFATHANLCIDGLSDEAFQGCVYGNPPFDGRLQGLDTINKALDKAELRSESHVPFRGVFFLPLTDARLRQRLSHPNVSLVIKFPNGTVPFTPDSYWYGRQKGGTACYDEEHTNLVLLKYENNGADLEWGAVDGESLSTKLAAWFLSLLPTHKLTKELLESTGLDARYFQQAQSTLPQELKVWRPCARTEGGSYVGATVDGAFLSDRPMRDAVGWSRKLAMTGCLPDSFEKFLHAFGYSPSTSTGVRRVISAKLRDHTRRLFRKYWKLMAAPNVSANVLVTLHLHAPDGEQFHGTGMPVT
jgi:hypothetical protein